MRDVSIIGIGQTPVGEHWGRSLRHLAYDAVAAAMRNANIERADALYVGNMLSGEISGQSHLGTLIADFAGLRGIEAVKVEAACASAAAAFRQAYIGVASGLQDIVIAVGVEKMTDDVGTQLSAGLAGAADADYEVIHGITFVALNALIMKRYMHEYNVAREDFAGFAINAHANAAANNNAMFQNPITKKDFVNCGVVADPVGLLDASPMADGAAAVILCPTEQAREFTDNAIRIKASALATDTLSVHDRRDPLWLQAAEDSSMRAYKQAGIGPEDIDFFELHDAFTIMAALSLEASGFAQRGHGTWLALDGEITPEGKIPISTRGGLKARGHPVGATGLYQIVEAAQQLRGEAGNNQIKNAALGMTQNIGGSGATIVTHIFERVNQ
ncbi:MAG TPA: thiolase domain-containing protein [Anaerolineae bacterium]|nr:thiolase domain-containing protein [Anaerolineae bacterium]MCB0222108.1 thiolase domain-containing protein [Anaerolineae bacterium]MCB9103580.1 thiolase domain-containing protein [Anaerolineales bacterium]HRV90986.1 thiolase domain-containing protein [Anaerolineae bacterium]